MRLFHLTTVYPDYALDFYGKRPELGAAAHAEQRRSLDHDGTSWSGTWGVALAALGYECFGVEANLEPLQAAWARENDIPWPVDWLRDLAAEQIIRFKPEILFMDDYHSYNADWVRSIRIRAPSIRLVLGWCSAPFMDASVFSSYDVTLSCIPEMVSGFLAMNHRSDHLHHGFDPSVLDRLGPTVPPLDQALFIGQISPRTHGERVKILSQVALTAPMVIHCLPERPESRWRASIKAGVHVAGAIAIRCGIPSSSLSRIPFIGRFSNLPQSQIPQELRMLVRPPLFGLDMFRACRGSRISLNSHTDCSPRSASNMRLFEATGVGACLVTDEKENMRDLFEPDREVVTYASAEECAEKVVWLLDHPNRCAAIGAAGQARTMRDHTYIRRAPVLDAIIRRELAR